MRNILPLANLPAFEAAARCESFTLAAEELNLSQAAVSRQIKHLEQRLGLALFERHHRSVALTKNGEELYRTVGISLRLIGDTVQNMQPDKEQGSVTIASDLAFSHFWLIPHLDYFQTPNHHFSISVTASDAEDDCLRSNVDLPILYGDGNWPGFDALHLMEEELFPVCSQSYLEGLGPLHDPEDLFRGKLLHVGGGPATWVNWSEWLANFNIDIPKDSAGIELNSLPWSIQAACAGRGIALGCRYLLDDLLANGTLIRPIPHTLSTARGYYFLIRQGSPHRPELEDIYHHLRKHIQNSPPLS